MPVEHYDVVVLGGAFSGGATSLLLKRDCPRLRVLIVEKAVAFDEKVGEATTEMSAMFLTRRLALWNHLEREHLPKEGLRHWFHNENVTGHENASETGGFQRSAVPSFQLRRDVLDEHILAEAVAAGAELRRPARVKEVQLDGETQTVTLEQNNATETVTCRWVLDATGRATFLGKRLGLIDRFPDHPTAALWARWQGVQHIDDFAARTSQPLARRNLGSRRLATNHYMGLGYWIWVIPLGNGETSIGIVWDKRLVSLHDTTHREDAYLAFLDKEPALRELLAGAKHRPEDFRYYSSLPYITRQYMGEGWALVGDAAAFLDPYYSPGLDHAAFSAEATAAIVVAQANGEDITARVIEHNLAFVRSYHRFFKAIYRDKYFYMGEHDLLSASMLLDTAQYYLFLVIPAYRFLGRFDWMPVLGPKGAFLNYYLMQFYHRRFKHIALARRAMGEAERRNHGRRTTAYFALNFAAVRMAAKGVKIWLLAELDYARLFVKALFQGRLLGRAARALEPAKTQRAAALATSPPVEAPGYPRTVG
jgi:flavin-dependent dehydrogenase